MGRVWYGKYAELNQADMRNIQSESESPPPVAILGCKKTSASCRQMGGLIVKSVFTF